MSDWTRVCALRELAPGAWRVVDVDGASVLIVSVAGEPHAIEDVCTHDGGELAGGTICGHVIECPRHGARFDLRTGQALCAPAYEPVHVFPIRIADGAIWVRDDRWD
jgi:3-phenylpropionate/trans-cinnamate dioxygenase ferredoxin subunit